MNNNSDKFQTPIGEIGMILHKGGEWDPNTNSLTPDAVIIKAEEVKNLIVKSASILMSQRLAPGAKTGAYTDGANVGDFIAAGLQYLAVGTMVDQNNPPAGFNWMNPPAATSDAVKLGFEIARKQFTSWTFLNADGSNSSTATNILKLTTTFLEGEAVGSIVEMGLFGGNATTTASSGYMFNYKTFPVWNKPSDARLTITWQLTF